MNTKLHNREWHDSVAWGCFLITLYVVLAALPLALAYWLVPASEGELVEELGKGAALLGFSIICLQFLLSARLHSIDRPFGLDCVMRFHKGMGIFAGALLLLHPVLLALSHGNWLLLTGRQSWPITLGKIALLLLVLTVLLALFFKRIRMDYNVWRIFHKVAILIVALGFVHALVLGPDLDNGFLRAYWFAMFAVVAFVFLWRNLYVPIWSRARYRVISVDKESHDTWTLAFAPEGGTKALVHHPGQFWFLKLIRPGRPSELHPFTISSSPTTEPPLTSTIKASGNFTRTIGETRAGDKARIEGPFGRFSLVNYPAHAFLFIAGGVGITPIMSMLRYLRDAADTRPVGLVYACKARKDMLFRDELADMPNNVHVTPILSSPEADWDRYEGYVNTELLQQEVDGLISQADIFLCGPPVMMEKVIQSLKELGVAKNRIHYERFTI